MDSRINAKTGLSEDVDTFTDTDLSANRPQLQSRTSNKKVFA